MKKLPDDELFRLVQADNERAFSILFDRYKQTMFRHIFQRIESYADAEEILQRIFIGLWENRKTIIVTESLGPYLMGAVKKSVLALYVQTSRQMERQRTLAKEESLLQYPAEDVIIAQELQTLVEKEVARMPATMRNSFELSRKEDLSIREIAHQLSISEQTVKNNISMALQRLRGRLNTRHFFWQLATLILPLIA